MTPAHARVEGAAQRPIPNRLGEAARRLGAAHDDPARVEGAAQRPIPNRLGEAARRLGAGHEDPARIPAVGLSLHIFGESYHDLHSDARDDGFHYEFLDVHGYCSLSDGEDLCGVLCLFLEWELTECGPFGARGRTDTRMSPARRLGCPPGERDLAAVGAGWADPPCPTVSEGVCQPQ